MPWRSAMAPRSFSTAFTSIPNGRGIGSALLDAVIAGHPRAKAIRLEVLKDNAAAIAWYRAKGFDNYGETGNATGTAGIASAYMDKKLVARTH